MVNETCTLDKHIQIACEALNGVWGLHNATLESLHLIDHPSTTDVPALYCLRLDDFVRAVVDASHASAAALRRAVYFLTLSRTPIEEELDSIAKAQRLLVRPPVLNDGTNGRMEIEINWHQVLALSNSPIQCRRKTFLAALSKAISHEEGHSRNINAELGNITGRHEGSMVMYGYMLDELIPRRVESDEGLYEDYCRRLQDCLDRRDGLNHEDSMPSIPPSVATSTTFDATSTTSDATFTTL